MIELSAIIVVGLLAQWIAWKMKIPAIFPLIILGLIMGPLSTLFLDEKWIDPENIFAGKTMYYFVSLSVGVILFEGGLTLKFKEVRSISWSSEKFTDCWSNCYGYWRSNYCTLFFRYGL